MITKKHLYISLVLIIIVTIGIVLFLQPLQQNNATEEMVQRLNEQYNETFEVTWSDINQQEHMETFNATVKSTKTNYVYDVAVKNGKASMDYEIVNAQMAFNESIEKAIPHSFASVNEDALTILTTAPISKEQLLPVIKSANVSTVDVYELNEENYTIATDHIKKYYQRSTMPIDDLAQYEPKKYTIEIQQ